LIDKLICPHRIPSEDNWLIYYYKQARPTATVEEISRTLGYSRRKIRNALMSFKSHPSPPLTFGFDVVKKILEHIMMEDEIGEPLMHFINAFNFCPAWPDWQDEEMARFIMELSDELLSPEMQVFRHTLKLIYDGEESLGRIFQNLLELRDRFKERGLYLLYWTTSVPVAYLSATLNAHFSSEEYRKLKKMLPHIPYFYRWLFELTEPYMDIVMGKIFHVSFEKVLEETGNDISRQFVLLMMKGRYQEALEMEPLLQNLEGRSKELIEIYTTNLRIFTSPVPPRYPDLNPEGVSPLLWFNRAISRLLLGRLKGEEPEHILSSIPQEIADPLRRVYIEPDIGFIKKSGWYNFQLILMLLDGKIDEAWKIARKNGLVYDFHLNYILLGFSPLELLRKYRLRIGWYPLSIEFAGDMATIHYGKYSFELSSAVSHLLREVVRGKGYLSDRAYRRFRRHLWFLKIKKKRKNGMNLVLLDEDIPVVEKRI